MLEMNENKKVDPVEIAENLNKHYWNTTHNEDNAYYYYMWYRDNLNYGEKKTKPNEYGKTQAVDISEAC